MCALHLSLPFLPPWCSCMGEQLVELCMCMCVCEDVYVHFFDFSESHLKEVVGERWEGGLMGAYEDTVNMLEHLMCPKVPRVSRDMLSPSPPLSSTEPCKCGCHSWSTPREGELSFLWYTAVLKLLPLNTYSHKSGADVSHRRRLVRAAC